MRFLHLVWAEKYPQTKFWGKMVQGPHHEGSAHPRDVTIGQQFHIPILAGDGTPHRKGGGG